MRRTQLVKLQSENISLQPPKAWLPINLSRELLLDIFSKHWQYPETFNIDKAIAICTLLIIKRYSVLPSDRGKFWQNGFSNIHSDEFRFWVGKKYTRYLEVLKVGGVIQIHDGYIAGGFPKAYKFSDVWVNSNLNGRKFKAEPYQNYNLKLKALRYKVANLEGKADYGDREGLVQNVKAVATEFDVEGLSKYLLAKKLRNAAKIEERELLIVRYMRLKDLDDFSVNPKDNFGRRFHSPFTNMKKEFRKFIRINGESCEEIDLKNSQFFFFACICQYSEVVYELLYDEWEDPEVLEIIISYIRDTYRFNADIQLFVDKAFDGTIYEFLQVFFDPTQNRSREYVKSAVFKILFSDGSNFKEIRNRMFQLFPTLVNVCENLNGRGMKYIPNLLQRLESKLMIDFIAKSAIDSKLGKFVTVHDSIICQASQAEKFKDHISVVFDSAGLPVPILQSQRYFQLAA